MTSSGMRAGLAWHISPRTALTLTGELFVTRDVPLAGGMIDNHSAAAVIGLRKAF